jgi:hypothetical protein
VNRYVIPMAIVAILFCANLITASPVQYVDGKVKWTTLTSSEQAMQDTRAISEGLLKGNSHPFQTIVLTDAMRQRIMSHLEHLQMLVPESARKTIKPTDDEWRAIAAEAGAGFKGGDCYLTRPELKDKRIAVTARFEKNRAPTYWRLRYTNEDGRFALEAVDVPLVGVSLAGWFAERIFFEAYKELIPKNRQAAPKSNGLRNFVGAIVIVMIAGFFLIRRRRPKTAKPAKRNPLVMVVIIALLAVVIIQLNKSSQKNEDKSVRTPEEIKLRALETRLILRLRMKQGYYPSAERLANELLESNANADDPAQGLVVRQYIMASIAQKKFDQVRNHLAAEAQAKEERRRAFALHWSAHVAVKEEKYGDAVTHLLGLQKFLGEDDAILVRMADALRNSRKEDEALIALARALGANKSSIDALILRARISVGREDYDAAAEDLRRLKKLAGLNIVLLERDDDFKKMKSLKQYADIFAND